MNTYCTACLTESRFSRYFLSDPYPAFPAPGCWTSDLRFPGRFTCGTMIGTVIVDGGLMMPTIVSIALVLLAYLSGSIPFSLLVARAWSVDRKSTRLNSSHCA